MSESATPVTSANPFRWILLGLLLTAMNGCWSATLRLEDANRKGQQRTFAPSPPLLPSWLLYTPYALLLLQLAVSAVGVWRVQAGRWWLAMILLVVWLIAALVVETRFS